jgi:hypothetical protein
MAISKLHKKITGTSIKGKKGILYLTFAIVFIMLISTLYLTYNAYQRTDRQQVITKRINTMNNFVIDINNDINRAAYISGFRALIGIEEYLTQKGMFFTNQTMLEEAFVIVFQEGAYNGTSLVIMENSSFNNYLGRVKQQAATTGIGVDINITHVTLEQLHPWIVHVTFTGIFNISNADNTFWWNYEKNFSTNILITGLKDPLYTVNTLGRVPNTIVSFTLPTTGFVNDTNNETDVLQAFVLDSYYKESPTAPSFLQRFTNNLSASPQGIESIVNLPALSDQGIVVLTDRSVVDYIYFSDTPNGATDRCNIQNMIYVPDWFRIDLAHMDDYELDGLSSSACP